MNRTGDKVYLHDLEKYESDGMPECFSDYLLPSTVSCMTAGSALSLDLEGEEQESEEQDFVRADKGVQEDIFDSNMIELDQGESSTGKASDCALDSIFSITEETKQSASFSTSLETLVAKREMIKNVRAFELEMIAQELGDQEKFEHTFPNLVDQVSTVATHPEENPMLNIGRTNVIEIVRKPVVKSYKCAHCEETFT